MEKTPAEQGWATCDFSPDTLMNQAGDLRSPPSTHGHEAFALVAKTEVNHPELNSQAGSFKSHPEGLKVPVQRVIRPRAFPSQDKMKNIEPIQACMDSDESAYRLNQVIGIGTFGRVYHASCLSGQLEGLEVAIKKNSEKQINRDWMDTLPSRRIDPFLY
ncbi:hypothetical protein DSO57_1033037 [Entomophthora muscae]|uniref:Uncharacterized protein n=1 Tax=Entomophthora muscae TaxID=34485 RepID=A0ACC2U978_9FUNG|nr:hypothetical protein DSO57_1033037 [Entomophthora muscae]